jgi:hypothetical protein
MRAFTEIVSSYLKSEEVKGYTYVMEQKRP